MINRRKTNKKYTLIFCCILGFVFLTFFIYSKSIQKHKEIAFFNENIKILDTANTIYFKKSKNEIENSLKSLADSIEYEKLSNKEYKRFLLENWKYINLWNNCITSIYLGYDENEIIADNWEKPLDYNMKERPWYIEGIKQSGTYWVNPYLQIKTKKLVGTITRPIRDKKGNIKGIFAIDIDLNSLSEILTSLNFGFNNETFLLNSDGKVIAHSMVNELSLDMQGTELLNQIEKSNKNYYIDANKDAYVFVKDSSNNWILVTRIPREILTQFKIDKEFINLILFISILIFVMYQLYLFIDSKMNKKYLTALKAVQSRDNLDELMEDVEKDSNEGLFFDEVKALQVRIENLERELLRDEETGLYNETYLKNYGKNFINKGQKILVIKYLNLSEIKNQYGKNVVELVLKRGAMTINALKEADEPAVRLTKDSLAIIFKSGDTQKRAHYIIDEILNYQWKLHNINLNIFPNLIDFDEYFKELDVM